MWRTHGFMPLLFKDLPVDKNLQDGLGKWHTVWNKIRTLQQLNPGKWPGITVIYIWYIYISTLVFFRHLNRQPFCLIPTSWVKEPHLSHFFWAKAYHLAVQFNVILLITSPSLTNYSITFSERTAALMSQNRCFALLAVARVFADHTRWPVSAIVSSAILFQAYPMPVGWGGLITFKLRT